MAVDRTLFRQIAGSFATGVTVITTGADGVFHGMTASAVASLSLDPPLILVCVDRTAETLPLLQRSLVFNVNILTEAQEELSRQFATKGSPQSSSFQGVGFHLGATGVPVIDGCLASFECRVTHQYDGGDHIIFVGSVIEGALREDAQPLVYYRSGYRRLAP